MRIFRLLSPFLIFLFIYTPAVLFSAGGEIVYMEGFGWIDHNSETIEADFGIPVDENDTITTDFDSLLIIQLDSGAEIKLRENTVLRLSDLGSSMKVDLQRGSIFSKVNKTFGSSYSVQARSVVAGVRGTQFFIAYGKEIEENPDIWLCVNEGTVEVVVPETGDSVLVEEGKGVNILAGTSLTPPKRYGWTQDLNWNMEPDSGSVKDETDLGSVYGDLLDQDYD